MNVAQLAKQPYSFVLVLVHCMLLVLVFDVRVTNVLNRVYVVRDVFYPK